MCRDACVFLWGQTRRRDEHQHDARRRQLHERLVAKEAARDPEEPDEHDAADADGPRQLRRAAAPRRDVVVEQRLVQRGCRLHRGLDESESAARSTSKHS